MLRSRKDAALLQTQLGCQQQFHRATCGEACRRFAPDCPMSVQLIIRSVTFTTWPPIDQHFACQRIFRLDIPNNGEDILLYLGDQRTRSNIVRIEC